MNAMMLFFCQILGINSEQYAAIAHHKAARNLVMRAVAICIGSIAFGVAVFSFTRALLQYDILPALVFGLVCSGVLFIIELNNIQDIIATGRITAKVVVTRIAVVGMMFMSSVVMAIFPMERDIVSHQAQATQQSTQLLEQDSRFAVQLEASRRATDQASKDVIREKELLKRLNELNVAHPTAKASALNECQGNIGIDGVKRAEGCGPRARGYEAEATRIDLERTAVSHELSALAGSTDRLNSAQGKLDGINGNIKSEAERINGGAASRLGALWHLMWNNGSALLIVGFYLVLSLLPEILVLTALSKPGVYAPIFTRLNDLECRQAMQQLDLLHSRIRDANGQEMPERHVRVPTSSSTGTVTTAHSGKTAANDGADAKEAA